MSHDEHLPTPAEAWEFRYQEQSQRWSGHANATLVDLVGGIPANGRALDLGCGEGADAIWLARQGWHVTGVDISPTAVARAQGAAVEAGIASDQVRFEAHDLSAWEPDGPYDLVTASFFHSREDLPRTDILRRAAGQVAPGGHLAIVSHAAPPPWSDHAEHDQELLLDADGEVAALGLGDDWEVVVSEHRQRTAVAHAGHTGDLEDVAVLLRRH
jgi:SAM-dependent methyltransferase